MDKYTPRRAGKCWTLGAPDFVFDCFDEPDFNDRFTVFLGGEYLMRTDRHTVIVPFVSSNESGGTYWGEINARELAGYRYRRKHRRIAWIDLPKNVRDAVRARVEE